MTDYSISWFLNYYPEIKNIFFFALNTNIKSEFPLNLTTYQAELINKINELLYTNKIQNTKTQILAEVQKFVQRKRKYRMFHQNH